MAFQERVDVVVIQEDECYFSPVGVTFSEKSCVPNRVSYQQLPSMEAAVIVNSQSANSHIT
jgi:hypothetical protein